MDIETLMDKFQFTLITLFVNRFLFVVVYFVHDYHNVLFILYWIMIIWPKCCYTNIRRIYPEYYVWVRWKNPWIKFKKIFNSISNNFYNMEEDSQLMEESIYFICNDFKLDESYWVKFLYTAFLKFRKTLQKIHTSLYIWQADTAQTKKLTKINTSI